MSSQQVEGEVWERFHVRAPGRPQYPHSVKHKMQLSGVDWTDEEVFYAMVASAWLVVMLVGYKLKIKWCSTQRRRI